MQMNESDITSAAQRFAEHPVLGPASVTLLELMTAVNSCSDGWPYWRAPSGASRQLQDLIETSVRAQFLSTGMPDNEDLAARLRRAYSPLRRFRTEHPQVHFRIHGAEGVPGDAPEPEAPAAPEQHTVRITVTGDRAVVEISGGGPLPPGRYLGAVVKLSDRREPVAS